MNIKKLAKNLLPPIVIEAAKYATGKSPQKILQHYLQNGRIPWSPGYRLYKTQLITQSISDNSMLERFRCGDPLPASYGYGIDERCIEYPWLFAHLPANAKRILDAGSVLNYNFILNNPIFDNKKLHILTLAPEPKCFWQKEISYIYEDLRDIPIQNDYYDAIVCLSTLEHVGCDNTFYTLDKTFQEHHPEDFVLAMKEMCRVLKPGGILFISVPFGVYHHFGMLQQFDKKLLNCVFKSFEFSKIIENYYKYTSEGWQIAAVDDCAKCEYVDWITTAWQHSDSKLPCPLPVEPDLAAAARAVACVQLIK
jgi:SAM-dependent methyltransferase